MAAVEAVLALLGILFVVFILHVALADDDASAPETEDLAGPYREGLHAAVRMQRIAQDLEQQIYAEAAHRLDAADGTERA
jgi:hypothetical protein